MRVIGEIPHPECKVTLFHWNNRYLIKLEHGLMEQTYKVQEYDVSSEDDVKRLVSEEFISQALRHFEGMQQALRDALLKV